jgi:hypothetical protein
MRHLLYWLCAALVITALYATIGGVVQNVLRSGANDPQLQLAEDAAARLSQGTTTVNPPGANVDIAASLAPFLIVYDRQGRVVSSSGQLNGQTPALPGGVLTSTPLGGEKRVTWQPQTGVRVAAVVVATEQGYIVSGRSLRAVEDRIGALQRLILAAWLLSLGALALTYLATHLNPFSQPVLNPAG